MQYCFNYTNLFLFTAAQSCTNETLRLVDGPVESAGRVEICINGVWGTVCGTNWGSPGRGWDNNAATVVCQQLGYSVNTTEGKSSFTGKESGCCRSN